MQNCFCQNFVKFSPILIIFGRKMVKRLKLCEVHSFSPHLIRVTTLPCLSFCLISCHALIDTCRFSLSLYITIYEPIYYPATHSMGGILTLLFFVCMYVLYSYAFLSRGFTDQRDIMQGGSAWSRTGLLPFWGRYPQGWPSFGCQQGPYGGICFLLKHLVALLSSEDVWV